MELTNNQKEALIELQRNYSKTKFNFYPKLKLTRISNITDKELYGLNNEGIISRTFDINKKTLIILTETGINLKL